MAEDATLLAGSVIARQPVSGYRAAIDGVLLGASVAAAGRALELGAGSGAALLVAAHWNREARFVGLESDPALADLARENVIANGLQARAEIVTGAIEAPPPDWRDGFDAVFFNPPFFDDDAGGRPSPDPARRAAFTAGAGGLRSWVDAALAAVKTRGYVTLVQRADRLDAVLDCFTGRAGDIRVRPVQPRAGEAASRVLVRARKGAKTPLTLLPALVLHEADGRWTAAAADVLEGRAQIGWQAN